MSHEGLREITEESDNVDVTLTMPRKRVTISMEPELLEWVDKQVEDKIEYRDRSHLIEIAVTRFKERVERD